MNHNIRSIFTLLFFALQSVFLMQCGDKVDAVSSDDTLKDTNDTDTTQLRDDTDSATDTTLGSDDTAQPGTDSDTADTLALLIDDFEDGDHISLLGGFWYAYTDVDNDGASTVTIPTDSEGNVAMSAEGYQSATGFQIEFALDKGNYEWDPYVGWGVTLGTVDSPYDVGEYSGISYWFKGSAHTVKIETIEVENYDFFSYSQDAAADWTEVRIPFEYFVQAGWGDMVDFVLSHVTNLGWQVTGATGVTGQVQIDNVGLLGGGEKDTDPDLVIREPEIPEKDTLDPVTVDNPLQTLAMTHLNRGYNITNWLEQAKFEDYAYDETYVTQLAAAGFSALRLPIDLDQYIENRDEYLAGTGEFAVEPLLFEILDNFEQWTADAGMSLTIDFHQYDKSLDINDPQYVEAAVSLWTAVAEHFALNTRVDIFYELMNEPELSAGVSSVDPDDYGLFAQQLIDGIRTVDTTHTILFGDVQWNNIDMLAMRTPFTDDNIIYVFHFYEPFIFTHQGAAWADMGTTREIPYPYSIDRWSEYSSDFGFLPSQPLWQFQALENYYRTGNNTWMYNQLVDAKRWAVENNVPVICNEFGVYDRSVLREDYIAYYTALIDLFTELEIPWQHWFMVMDPETGAVSDDLTAAFQLQ